MTALHGTSPIQKILVPLLSLILAVAFLPSAALAAPTQDGSVTAQASVGPETYGDITWSIDAGGTLSIMASDGKAGTLTDVGGTPPWAEHRQSIKSVTFGKGVSLSGMMAGMFRGCTELVSVDFSGVDTSEVNDMKSMFSSCSSLTEVNFDGVDTANVQMMDGMFNGCSSLVTLDLSSFDTSFVGSFNLMFANCSSLVYLDISGFDTEYSPERGKPTMSNMFGVCDSLTRVKIGDAFVFQDGASSYLPEGPWKSADCGQNFDAEQIATLRARTADTYTNVNPAGDEPVITDGTEQTWTQGSNKDLVFSSDALFLLFDGVQVDGETIDAASYDVASGSTTVTLKASYLESLDPGEHTVAIVSATGAASTPFTVEAAPKPVEPDTPNKPDDSKPDTPDNPKPDTPDEPDNPKPTEPTPSKPDTPAVQGTPMYRLYNPNSGEHFYTASIVERDDLIWHGWKGEGIAWYAPTSGQPVYRMYNPVAGEHHYTTSDFERGVLYGRGWNDEGIGWYTDSENRVPVYRVYNPNAYANNHHYTTDWGERDILVAMGWNNEGVGWYGVGN